MTAPLAAWGDVPVLPLDSARWAELPQAYGSGLYVARILAHLDQVTDDQRVELWLGLWATLCRRGRVYPAAYAALPHIVAYAARRAPAERARALHLAATIEVGRQGAGADAVPADLAPAYDRALAIMPRLVADAVGESWDPDTVQALCGVLAVAKGHVRFGNAALHLEATGVCPVCGAANATPGWNLPGSTEGRPP